MKSRADSSPRVAAIVPVYRGAPWVAACLDALAASTYPDLEIIVVDDGSDDESAAIAREVAPRCQRRIAVVALTENRGFAAAVNRGVAEALGLAPDLAPDVLVLVNQDCIVERGWLEPLVRALADTSVAVAGARLTALDGVTLQHAGARIEANGLTSHVGRGCRDPLAYRDARDADYVCGALLAMRTDVWREYGPFDEGYAPAYFEEVDFCVRVRRGGRRVVYVPSSEARHAEAALSGGADSALFLGRYHRSRIRFVVRCLIDERGAAAWLGAEARWLLSLRRWREIRPVLAAYASIPGARRQAAR